MNDSELHRILQGAAVPERPPAYWERFPREVRAEIQRRENAASLPPEDRSGEKLAFWQLWSSAPWFRPALAVTAVAVCVVLAFLLGLRQGRHSMGADAQLAEAQKCFREVAPLFPNQLQVLVLDPHGARLVLADQPDVPQSAPFYIRVTGPHGVHRFVTFSGQHIRVNGDTFEVLVDRQGEVLLVGNQSVWSSSEPGAKAGPYRIEARPLAANS